MALSLDTIASAKRVCSTADVHETATTVVAVIPAHNEGACIADTLRSIQRQTTPPSRILVVADNCTDDTAAVAAAAGADVLVLKDNAFKKAGALNAALDKLLPSLRDSDAILEMDADSQLGETWVESAVGALGGNVGAVGALYYGRSHTSVLAILQRNEYARGSRWVERRDGSAYVLSGTASLFLVGALRAVQRARKAHELPGERVVYDISSITEDFELTMALKHLGYICVSPQGCTVITDVMTSWVALYHQRLRWQRGAVDLLRAYGYTQITRSYLLRSIYLLSGLSMALLFWVALLSTILLLGGIEASPLLALAMPAYLAERTWTVRRVGRRSVLLAALLIPEMLYELFIQLLFVHAMFDSYRNLDRGWTAT
jgi:poly-beta-1,6-N-acetyl-D-glucosamine synthase